MSDKSKYRETSNKALSAVNNGSVETDAASNWRLCSIGFKHATELRLLRLSAGSPSVSAGRTVLLRGQIGWTCEDKNLDGRRLADEEVVMPGGSRSAASAVDERRLAELIRPVVSAAGMDLESVRVTMAGRRRLLRVVVDSDHGVSLDDAADISREVSATLDATDVIGDVPYTLEVSSPGVDRPLTEPQHWRRAAGRLVRVKTGTAGTVQGRVVAADADGVTLDVEGAARRFSYGDLGAGAVQVEFGRIPEADPVPYEADLGAGGAPGAWRHPRPGAHQTRSQPSALSGSGDCSGLRVVPAGDRGTNR